MRNHVHEWPFWDLEVGTLSYKLYTVQLTRSTKCQTKKNAEHWQKDPGASLMEKKKPTKKEPGRNGLGFRVWCQEITSSCCGLNKNGAENARRFSPLLDPILPFPKNWGPFFCVHQNKDYSIWGSILGSPYFGKLPREQSQRINGQRFFVRDYIRDSTKLQYGQ